MINSDNELDSESEDEDERLLLIAGNQEQGDTLADNGKDAVVRRALEADGVEGEPEGLAEGTLKDCGEEGILQGQASAGNCDGEGEVTLQQTTPFIASEIKEELQPDRLLHAEEQLMATEEQTEKAGQDIENQSITPEHFLSQLLGGDHIQSLQRKNELLEDNIEDEMIGEVGSGVEENLATGGFINDALLDAAAVDKIGVEVAEKEQVVLEEEPGQRDTCPLCAESGKVFSAGQNEMATHFVQVSLRYYL